MEAVLETTAAHAPNFDPAFAMGHIHSILSALIEYCRTRAAYLYTGCFACELHIRPGGTALVPPVEPNSEAKMELLRMWEIVRGMDVPSAAPIFTGDPKEIPAGLTSLDAMKLVESVLSPNPPPLKLAEVSGKTKEEKGSSLPYPRSLMAIVGSTHYLS